MHIVKGKLIGIAHFVKKASLGYCIKPKEGFIAKFRHYQTWKMRHYVGLPKINILFTNSQRQRSHYNIILIYFMIIQKLPKLW